MINARFGRWGDSKCISGHVGQTGCWVDVLREVDITCSGKQNCQLPVTSFIHIQPCSKDYMSYLKASYKCIPVISRSDCTSSPLYSTKTEVGNILISKDMDHGDPSCPWVRSTHVGRRYNISVTSIGDNKDSTCKEAILVIGQASLLTGHPISVKRIRLPCPPYKTTSKTPEIPSKPEASSHSARGVQSTYKRPVKLFITSGNSISFYFRNVNSRRFLVTYKAIGCVTPDQSDVTTKVSRLGFTGEHALTGDQVELSCSITQLKVEYTCTEKGVWLSSKDSTRTRRPECPGERSPPNHVDRMGVVKGDTMDGDLNNYSVVRGMGIVIAVTIGALLGIVVGSSLLCLIVCVRKRPINQEVTLCSDHAQLYNTSGRNYGNNCHGYTMKSPSLPGYESETCRCSLVTYEPRTEVNNDIDTTAI